MTTTQLALYGAAAVVFALVFRRVLWRFLVGHHIGRARTNYGLIKRATATDHNARTVTRWGMLSQAERSAARLLAVALVAAFVYGWFTDRALTVRLAVAVAVAVMLAVGAVEYRKVRRWHHRRKYVVPLHQALGPVLGVDPTARPESWLTVPLRFTARGDGKPVTVKLPRNFTGEARKAVESITRAKLGLTECDAEFRLVGQPVAVFRKSPKPPGKVMLDDVRALIERGTDGAPLIGLGTRGVPVSVDLDAESPHVLVSAGSGGGKSVLLRFLLAQGLRNGGIGLILDVKRVSQVWARALPNVRYCRAVEEIHDALLWAKAEVERRYDLIDAGADVSGNVDHVDVGPRLFILAEEMNATINRLQAYWKEIKDKNDPAVSPAVQALGDVLFMGRAGKVHVLAVAQMMTARTLGGPEARENFATRILARYTVNNFRMLCPEVWPVPKSSRHAGRAQVVIAGQVRETQVAFTTPDEARVLAVSGTVAQFPAGGSPVIVSQTQTQPDASPVAYGSERPTGPSAAEGAGPRSLHLVSDSEADPVGLSDAVTQGVLTAVSLEAARVARKRDPEFPHPVGKRGTELLYRPDDLARWERNRPRAGRAVGGEA